MWKVLKMHNFIFNNVRRSPTYNQVIRVKSVSSVMKDPMNLKPWSQIPGPKSYPFIGPLLSFLPGGEFNKLGFIKLIQELNGKYGPIVKLDGMLDKKPLILLYDAESSAQILRGENTTPIRQTFDTIVYYRRKMRNKPPGSPLGLIGVHGKEWQEFRTTVNPVLLQPKTVRLYTSAIDEVALEMVERLKLLRDDKNMILNIDKQIHLWSLESIGVIALGCRVNCFDNNLEKDSPVQQLLDVDQNIMKVRNKSDILKPNIWKYYGTKKFKKTMEYYKKQEILARHFINKAIKEFQLNPKPDDQKGVLEKLLEINEDVALVMVSDMLLAGVETTANSVLGVLYLLATNPEKQTKLRAELKTNHKKSPYLKACVKEAIRMMPIASGNGRETTKEYSILGYEVPKGVNVICAHQFMSCMDKYFMKPHEYIPERWIVDKDDPLSYKNGHPFAYSPFGFGTRSCIGRRIAELEMESFIKRVIDNFEIKWFGLPAKVKTDSVNYMERPYNFVFNDVKN